jgi:integrase
MPSDKLTELGIKKSKSSIKEKKLYDGKGLYLLLHTNGSKYWRVKYRFLGKEKVFSLGVWPNISLTDARKIRNEVKIVLKSGQDPNVVKNNILLNKQVDQLNTFKAVADEWLLIKEKEWKQNNFQDVKRAIENHLYPDLGHRPLSEITSAELLLVLKKIEGQGKYEATRRARQKCEAIFRYANLSQRCENNPASNLKGALASPKKKKFNALNPEELPEFLIKLNEYNGSIITKLALRLVLYTLARTAEIRFATWNEFDLESSEPLWRVPKERMKMGIEHHVPLSSQSLRVIKQVRKYSEGDHYVFHQINNPNKPMSENTMLYAIYRMGYRSHATVHGFRATISTLLNENEYNPDVIERLLSHQEKNKVRDSYNRAEYLPQRKKYLQWLGDYLDKIDVVSNKEDTITIAS